MTIIESCKGLVDGNLAAHMSMITTALCFSLTGHFSPHGFLFCRAGDFFSFLSRFSPLIA
jgi:hypothetical protein